ncbi:hypothetical protein D3C85_1210370 [compost metagenome]
MGAIVDFLVFLLVLPALALFVSGSLIRSAVDYVGAWLIPGIGGIYFGAGLAIMGRPDPDLEYQTIIQSIAAVTVGGVAISSILIAVGIVSIPLGVILRQRSRRD